MRDQLIAIGSLLSLVLCHSYDGTIRFFERLRLSAKSRNSLIQCTTPESFRTCLRGSGSLSLNQEIPYDTFDTISKKLRL